ncbi:MAG: dihydroorotase [Pseudomonadota bacterium]
MQSITITKPDDFHLHLRDGDAIRYVVNHSAAQFARATIMPNLSPPVLTTADASAYRDRILKAVDDEFQFEPLMTLYLTDNTRPEEIELAANSGFVKALKYYPAGATTNSDQGVTDMKKTYATLQAMSEAGLMLLVHGEVTDSHIDIFDREAVFIDKVLKNIVNDFPNLKIVFEHITTQAAVKFVMETDDNIAATITPQHLLLNRNDLFRGGIRPHHYCLPILKAEDDRQAIMQAAVSGNPKFFLGTDSAPHARHLKESACGCAGMYTAHIAMELYAEAFTRADQLEKLEAFASFYGADFYGLPRNKNTITLIKQEQTIPETFPFASDTLMPYRAGEICNWQMQ